MHMAPISGEEIFLNEFEMYIMRWFVQRKRFKDQEVIEALERMLAKFKGDV